MLSSICEVCGNTHSRKGRLPGSNFSRWCSAPCYSRSKWSKAVKKVYHQNHRTEIAAVKKVYYQAHRAERLAWQKLYYQSTRAERLAWQKLYDQSHRAEIAARKKLYDQRKKAEREMSCKSI